MLRTKKTQFPLASQWEFTDELSRRCLRSDEVKQGWAGQESGREVRKQGFVIPLEHACREEAVHLLKGEKRALRVSNSSE